MAVTPEFTPQEAEALLTCVREYIAILLERGRLGDQMLSAAGSDFYGGVFEAGGTPPRNATPAGAKRPRRRDTSRAGRGGGRSGDRRPAAPRASRSPGTRGRR